MKCKHIGGVWYDFATWGMLDITMVVQIMPPFCSNEPYTRPGATPRKFFVVRAFLRDGRKIEFGDWTTTYPDENACLQAGSIFYKSLCDAAMRGVEPVKEPDAPPPVEPPNPNIEIT